MISCDDMASLEARFGESSSSKMNGQTGLCRSAEDVELLDKLTAFTACANRGDVIKALDAANLVFAHGMFKCGTQRTSVTNRAGILSQCAQRFLGVSLVVILLRAHASLLCKRDHTSSLHQSSSSVMQRRFRVSSFCAGPASHEMTHVTTLLSHDRLP